MNNLFLIMYYRFFFDDFRVNTMIMGNWKKVDNNPDKDLISIGAMFELGKIKRMYDIITLSPTRVLQTLGVSHERYVIKLTNPDKFSVSEILRMGYIFNVDPNFILDVIQKETEKTIVQKIEVQRKKIK